MGKAKNRENMGKIAKEFLFWFFYIILSVFLLALNFWYYGFILLFLLHYELAEILGPMILERENIIHLLNAFYNRNPPTWYFTDSELFYFYYESGWLLSIKHFILFMFEDPLFDAFLWVHEKLLVSCETKLFKILFFPNTNITYEDFFFLLY